MWWGPQRNSLVPNGPFTCLPNSIELEEQRRRLDMWGTSLTLCTPLVLQCFVAFDMQNKTILGTLVYCLSYAGCWRWMEWNGMKWKPSAQFPGSFHQTFLVGSEWAVVCCLLLGKMGRGKDCRTDAIKLILRFSCERYTEGGAYSSVHGDPLTGSSFTFSILIDPIQGLLSF